MSADVWQMDQKHSECALNHKITPESLKLFARLMPVFLLKKRPSFARLFTKMSPSEELVTLHTFDDKCIL